MARITQDRGPVGRRLWRRRRTKRKVEGTSAEGAAEPPAPWSDEAPGDSGPGDGGAARKDMPPKRGMFAALRRWLTRDDGEALLPFAEEPSSAPSTDLLREVLSVPRGAARLDAFESALARAAAGTDVHKSMARAFARELQSLADGAGVDLALFGTRVEACAQALTAAGDDALAAGLLLRGGKKHEALHALVSAGAIDALEETYAEINWNEGGVRLEARRAFERFEALLAVGRRAEALDDLRSACARWPENAAFTDVERTLLARVPPPHALQLEPAPDPSRPSPAEPATRVLHGCPVVVGRGADADVVIDSPVVSRAHVRVDVVDGAFVLTDIDGRGRTFMVTAPSDGAAATDRAVVAPLPLAAGIHEVRLGAVTLRIDVAAADRQLVMTPHVPRATRTVVVVGAGDVIVDDTAFVFDARGRACARAGVTVNGDVQSTDLLLFSGDRVAGATATWIVGARR